MAASGQDGATDPFRYVPRFDTGNGVPEWTVSNALVEGGAGHGKRKVNIHARQPNRLQRFYHPRERILIKTIGWMVSSRFGAPTHGNRPESCNAPDNGNRCHVIWRQDNAAE
jgi:hypothetical protein